MLIASDLFLMLLIGIFLKEMFAVLTSRSMKIKLISFQVALRASPFLWVVNIALKLTAVICFQKRFVLYGKSGPKHLFSKM
ncbi:hypothetical protein SE17_04115 [Kouleothrix aurantiaca]|uniref:Uncharacterized protein n=1 Tax=Kouleothrix aurantiaca TaxID=186479 RepID=A0A0P9HHS9_9CHLR|nr:hypothetical protein SE17_04115 [Kouleothrix aurantiaca]